MLTEPLLVLGRLEGVGIAVAGAGLLLKPKMEPLRPFWAFWAIARGAGCSLAGCRSSIGLGEVPLTDGGRPDLDIDFAASLIHVPLHSPLAFCISRWIEEERKPKGGREDVRQDVVIRFPRSLVHLSLCRERFQVPQHPQPLAGWLAAPPRCHDSVAARRVEALNGCRQ